MFCKELIRQRLCYCASHGAGGRKTANLLSLGINKIAMREAWVREKKHFLSLCQHPLKDKYLKSQMKKWTNPKFKALEILNRYSFSSKHAVTPRTRKATSILCYIGE